MAGSLLLLLTASARRADCQDGPIIAPGMDVAPVNTYPNQQYYLGLELYRDGDLANAMVALDNALSRTRRDPSGRWIDAIPVHALIAECLYQAGDLPGAVDNIDSALALAIRHRGWLGALTWNDLATGAVRPPDAAAAWAAPQIPSLVPMSGRLSIASGDVDLSGTLQRGGVLETAKLTRIDAVEVLRGLATALYRRRVIFGAISGEYEISNQTLEATRYPKGLGALPRTLIGAMRGCGKFAAGKRDELISDVGKSASFANAVHPLSPILLLAGAREIAVQDDFAAAVPMAMRAASAASALGQPEWVGEALLVAAGCVDEKSATTLQQAGTAAAAAHQRRGRLATVGALAAACDAALTANDTRSAVTLLEQLRTYLNRRDLAQPRLAAHGEYLSAMTAATGGASLGGESTAVDEALTRLLTFTSGNSQALRRGASRRRGGGAPASPRLYQLALVGADARGRGVGGRAVEERLTRYVGVPPASVWRSDPVDAIAYCALDHSQSIAGQIASAIQRNSPADVLVHTDALLRARFLASLPLGGRVQQIRRLASGDKTLVGPAAIEVLAKPPAKLRTMVEILATPPPPLGSGELTARGRNLESLATQLALTRGVVPETSPRPLVDSKDLDRLPSGYGLLSFVDVGGTVIGSLASGQTIEVWDVPAPRQLSAEVAKLLRGIGANVGRSRTSRLDDEASWKADAAGLRRKLIPDARLADLESLQHLVIVPDGVLWYLPMELLPLGDENAALLGEQLAVRYAPTPGLAIHPSGHADLQRPIGTATQLFFAPRDGKLNSRLNSELVEAIQQHQSLPGETSIPSRQLGRSIGYLAVLGAITPNPSAPLATLVSLYDRHAASGSLAAWLRFPSQPPAGVFLPGFRTAAGSAQLGNGRELFMTLTALHVAGVRDIVISRWPVGGESTAALAKEFLQELPFEGVEPAWRRAVQALHRATLDPETEPLLGAKDQNREELLGDHPLFWAGYILDTPPSPR